MAGAKITTATLRARKREGKRIVALTAYDHTFAALLDAAEIDVVLVGDSVGTVVQGLDTTVPVTMDQMVYHCSLVARARPRGLTVGDLPFGAYQVSADDAVRNAGRLLKEGGMEAVKLEGGGPMVATVQRLTDAGIAVMGHLGLTPQSIHHFGSYKVRGTERDQARRIVADAQALEQAGAFALVLEKVPAELGAEVTGSVGIPTIGIGAGNGCDGQVLVTYDLLGLFTAFRPRFVRRYANLADTIEQALRSYADDVRAGRFPGPEESY